MAGAHVVTPYVVIKTVETFDDQKDPVVPGTPRAMIKPSALQQRWDTGEMTRDKQVSLGEYLRHQRAEMAPRDRDDVSPLSHRRVPGLRRQELADTAGISVDYYTRIEQGRASHPSREILNALARAFQLSEAELQHLFRLAGESPPRPRTPASQVRRPGLRQLLDRMPNTIPVIIIDGRLDVLAFNDARRRAVRASFQRQNLRPQRRLSSLHLTGAFCASRERRSSALGASCRSRTPQGDEASTRRTTVSARCFASCRRTVPNSTAIGNAER